jgi:hypothetical protein
MDPAPLMEYNSLASGLETPIFWASATNSSLRAAVSHRNGEAAATGSDASDGRSSPFVVWQPARPTASTTTQNLDRNFIELVISLLLIEPFRSHFKWRTAVFGSLHVSVLDPDIMLRPP